MQRTEMKTARTILLVAFALLANVFTISLVIPFLMIDATPDFIGNIVVGSLILAALVAIACIVFGFATINASSFSHDNRKGLGIQVMVIKLLLIPYFVVTTALVMLMMFASSLLTISIQLTSAGLLFGAATAFVFAILTVVNVLFILATSSFSISNIVIEYRGRGIALPTAVTFIILQLIPVVDVISYCCIAFYFRSLHKDRGYV
ncbi:MAG: hypothetical protein RR505_03400 [Raoultibacter sp.]